MAYGQTGTGKTFTLGRLGDGDIATRGIMVRAMEDILTNISSENDSVSVSYLQVISYSNALLSWTPKSLNFTQRYNLFLSQNIHLPLHSTHVFFF